MNHVEHHPFAQIDSAEALDLYKTFIEESRTGFVAFDLELNYTYWSPAMERISGIPCEAVLGKNADALIPACTGNSIAQVLNGETICLDWTAGESFFSIRYVPRRHGGRIVGGLGFVIDTTGIRRAEQLRGESENRFANMANASPVMLWMSNADSTWTFFNQTWLDFTGRTMPEEAGVGWAEGVHQEDFQRCMDAYMSAFESRQPLEVEYRLKRFDGKYRWILDRGTPRYSTSGIFEGFVGSCVDISERKKMEADLRDAVRVREDFISIASHELRTPLTALNLQVGVFEHLIANSHDLNLASGRIRSMMQVARRQIGHLSDLIEKLLDLSRISAGKLGIERHSTDLVQTAADVRERLVDAAARVGSSIIIHSDCSVVGSWDKSRIDQVLSNLVNNSLKYAAGTPIEIGISSRDGFALIEVEDGGPGISKEYMSQVFDKFKRGTNDANLGGLGLGLFIAREIVHAHEGTIEVQNKPGCGVKFKVRLPV